MELSLALPPVEGPLVMDELSPPNKFSSVEGMTLEHDVETILEEFACTLEAKAVRALVEVPIDFDRSKVGITGAGS